MAKQQGSLLVILLSSRNLTRLATNAFGWKLGEIPQPVYWLLMEIFDSKSSVVSPSLVMARQNLFSHLD